MSNTKPHRRRTIRDSGWTVATGLLAVVALLLPAMPAVAGGSIIPDADDVVLETLPRQLVAERDGLDRLREDLAADPQNMAIAIDLAGRYIEIGSQGSDPRFYGYARATLAPWWDSNPASPGLLLLRAKLHEKDHRFDAAADQLEHLLAQQPDHRQATIELSNIYRVQGRYPEALRICERLADSDQALSYEVCRIPTLAMTGQAEQAYTALVKMLPLAQRQNPTAVQWILTQQATIAEALALTRLAAQHYRDAQHNRPDDAYLLRAYADFLLDQDAAQEVVTLLQPHLADNGVLLRATIAARRSGQHALASRWQSELGARFDEIRLRGDLPHGRFESRYALELLDEPVRALALAQANWERQKEPRDSHNLLQAALAADRPEAIQPVRAFLTQHGTQHAALTSLLQ